MNKAPFESYRSDSHSSQDNCASMGNAVAGEAQFSLQIPVPTQDHRTLSLLNDAAGAIIKLQDDSDLYFHFRNARIAGPLPYHDQKGCCLCTPSLIGLTLDQVICKVIARAVVLRFADLENVFSEIKELLTDMSWERKEQCIEANMAFSLTSEEAYVLDKTPSELCNSFLHGDDTLLLDVGWSIEESADSIKGMLMYQHSPYCIEIKALSLADMRSPDYQRRKATIERCVKRYVEHAKKSLRCRRR